jgi:site-specific DNA recombinase
MSYNRLRMEGRASINAAQAEVEKIGREEKKLMDLYLKDALSVDAVKERGDQLKARKAELSAFLATADDPPPLLLHPSMAQLYRSRVQSLYDALQGEDEEKRTEAADIIRTLVEDIVLTPVDGKVEIDVRGDLAGILTLSVQTKNPARRAGSSQLKMVAGVVPPGPQPTAFHWSFGGTGTGERPSSSAIDFRAANPSSPSADAMMPIRPSYWP